MIKDLFKKPKIVKIFGTAGAGKTTHLIDRLDKLFKEGNSPERIAFASFTNKAVDEMVDRLLLKFPKFSKAQFNYFKTIHALCYKTSPNKNLMKPEDFIKIAKALNLEVSYYSANEEGGGAKKGDRVLTVESLSRLKMKTLQEQWQECAFHDCPFYLITDWKKALDSYKAKNRMIDFTDLLESYNGAPLDVDYFFIDEAQDLSPLQWKVLDQMAANCKTVFIAGDDDQLIYNWAGAEVEYILDIRHDEEVILDKSHRLPTNIYKLTREVLSRIKKRKPKDSLPVQKEGKIEIVNSFESIDFDKNQEYLILVRNKIKSRALIDRMEYLGFPYYSYGNSSIDCPEITAIKIWEKFRKNKIIDYKSFEKCQKLSTLLSKEDKDSIPEKIIKMPWFEVFNIISLKKVNYFRRLLEKGHKLSENPKIKISTIHQAKGGECENVIVITDVSKTTWKNIKSDDEHRVWYVAISRAKKNLTIVREQSELYYKI